MILSGGGGGVYVLSAVPSLDTPTCSTETKRFNEEAAKEEGPEDRSPGPSNSSD